MQAMVLKKLGSALEWTDLADRPPGPGEIRVKVAACGVCRTDLHVVDGERRRLQTSSFIIEAPPRPPDLYRTKKSSDLTN
jgi:D-arabinose 1-dehydrogenase-like Zn-dependent alcohol dehydrogenase